MDGVEGMMVLESPDIASDFPGLLCSELSEPPDGDEHKRRDGLRKKDFKKDRKDKGYVIFAEEDDSEEELVESFGSDDSKKMKKQMKHSFKFSKKEKQDRKKEEKQEKKKEEKKEKSEKKKEEKEVKKLKWRFKHLSIPKSAPVPEHPVFGVPLGAVVEKDVASDNIPLPTIFRECIDYVEEFGLECEGIYRISGVKSKVQALKNAYNSARSVSLQDYEPNEVASLLKQFLRELPEPVLTAQLTPQFEAASALKNVKQKVEQFQTLTGQLPTCNRCLLAWTIIHMTHVIMHESVNKMSLQNVGIVLSPTLQISHRVLHVFFTYSKILFRDTAIKRYVPALKPQPSRWSLDMPENLTALEEELQKQESILNSLHHQVMIIKDVVKEEQLWEVQRLVTQLKRKIKGLQKQQKGFEDVGADAYPPLLQRKSSYVSKLSSEGASELCSRDKRESTSSHSNDAEGSPTDPKVSVHEHSATTKDKEKLASSAFEEKKESIETVKRSDGEVTEVDSSELAVNEAVEPAKSPVEFMSDDELSDHEFDELTDQQLVIELNRSMFEQEELLLLHVELQRKMETERHEITRLGEEIDELRRIRATLYDDSSSEESDEEEEEEMLAALLQLNNENCLLKANNYELSEKINHERALYLKAKVDLRMMQLRRSSMLLSTDM